MNFCPVSQATAGSFTRTERATNMPSVTNLRSQARAIMKQASNEQVKELAHIVEQLCTAVSEAEKTASTALDEARKARQENRRG